MNRDTFGQIRRILDPLRARLQNLVARAVVQVVDDGAKLQRVQVGAAAGEDIDDGEHFQPYGFASVPPAGSEAVVLFPNGDRSHPLVIVASDRATRLTGQAAGEVAIYHPDGARVILRDGGDVEIYPGSGGEVRIGSAGASDPVALKSDLQAVYDAISGGVPVAMDGGAALQTTIVAALDAAGFPVAANKVKAE